MAKKINEATSTDLPIIQRLVNEYGRKVGDTLLYQQIYDIPENLKNDYPNLKNIRPDIALQDLNGEVLAIIENNLDKENKDLLKLRTVVTHLLNPCFLYACGAERILFNSSQSLPPRGLCGTTRMSRRNERKAKKCPLEEK